MRRETLPCFDWTACNCIATITGVFYLNELTVSVKRKVLLFGRHFKLHIAFYMIFSLNLSDTINCIIYLGLG
eukprot:gene2693-1691_t